MARAGQAADAAGLLVRVRAHDQLAADRAGDGLRRDHHRGDPALHVARAAAADPAVAHQRVEGIVVPAVLAPGGDDVDVAVQEQRPAAAGAAEAGRELRAALEADPARRRDRVALHVGGLRLPDVDVRAGAGEPVGEVGLEGGLVTGRLARVVAAGGVEPDQLAQERDQVVLAGGDRVDQPLLLGSHRPQAMRIRSS